MHGTDVRRSLEGCDLAGYNLKRFDLKVLIREFARCGIDFDLTGRSIIDVQEIFFNKEPRDLGAAVKFYLDREHEQAHSAEADVLATARILEAMIPRYGLPQASDQLAAAFADPTAIDIEGFFQRRDGVIYFAKGKHQGKPAAPERAYLHWMLDLGDFLPDARRVCRQLLNPSEE